MSARDGLAPQRSDLFLRWDTSTKGILRLYGRGVRRATNSWRASSLTLRSLASTKTWENTHVTYHTICACSRRSEWTWHSFPQLRRSTRQDSSPMLIRQGPSPRTLRGKAVLDTFGAWQLWC